MSCKDSLKRSVGITKWLALIDVDEFILPMFEKTIPQCLDKHFPNASGIYVNWYNFGTNNVYLSEGESTLFKLTACADPLHSCNAVGKSIVRPEFTLPDQLWCNHFCVMKPEGQYYYGDGQKLAFKGSDLDLDGKQHHKFLRINHYYTRDEWFFRNVKLVRTPASGGANQALLWEHYHAFNKNQDKRMVNFIMRKHPDSYNQYWKKHIFD
jgi:hypothetical protein